MLGHALSEFRLKLSDPIESGSVRAGEEKLSILALFRNYTFF